MILDNWIGWLQARIPVAKEGHNVFWLKQAFCGYAEYWQQRCLLAENALDESPCDPDITDDQIKAHRMLKDFIENRGLNLTDEIRHFFKGKVVNENDFKDSVLKSVCQHEWLNGVDNSFKRCKKCLEVEYL